MTIRLVYECSTICCTISSDVDSPFNCTAHQGIVGHHHVLPGCWGLGPSLCHFGPCWRMGVFTGLFISVSRVRLKVKLKTTDIFNLRWSCSALYRKDGLHPKSCQPTFFTTLSYCQLWNITKLRPLAEKRMIIPVLLSLSLDYCSSFYTWSSKYGPKCCCQASAKGLRGCTGFPHNSESISRFL